MTLILVGAAARTPLGDLDATIAACAASVRPTAVPEGVHRPETAASDFVVGSRTARLLGPLPALAVEVARTAAAGVPRGERTGVYLATGGLRAHWDELAPAMAEQRADARESWARGLRRLHPLWMLRYLSNGAQAAIAHELGLVGDGATFAGAASAASALVAAQHAIDAGTIDHAVVIGLDDPTAIEAAVELASRRPDLIPAAAVVAVTLSRSAAATATAAAAAAATAAASVSLSAADGIDPDHAEPSRAAIAAVRARLPRADRDLAFAHTLGWLGAAAPLVDAAIAARFLAAGWPPALDLGAPTSITCTAAASPGQIGIIRVELHHD